MRPRMVLWTLNIPSKDANRVKPIDGTVRQVIRLTEDLFCGDNKRLVIKVSAHEHARHRY
jgi:hypothetical protein